MLLRWLMKLEDDQIAAHGQAAAAVPVPDCSELLGEAMALHTLPTILAARWRRAAAPPDARVGALDAAGAGRPTRGGAAPSGSPESPDAAEDGGPGGGDSGAWAASRRPNRDADAKAATEEPVAVLDLSGGWRRGSARRRRRRHRGVARERRGRVEVMAFFEIGRAHV